MAKAALDHFGRCYSLILAEKGIRINTLKYANFNLKESTHSEKNTMKRLYIQKVHEKWSIFCFYDSLCIVIVAEIMAFEVGDF